MTSQDFPNAGWPEEEYPAEEFDSTLDLIDEQEVADEPAYPVVSPPLTALKLDVFTIPQLRAYAADHGVDLGSAKKHADLVKIILASQPIEPTPAAPGFDLTSLYEHMPPAFTETLTKALHARGLVEAGDYFKPGAAQLFRSAMLGVIKQDFLSAQALAKKVWVENAGRKRGSR